MCPQHRFVLICALWLCNFATVFAQIGTGSYDPKNERWVDLGVDDPSFGWQTVGKATWTPLGEGVTSDGKQGWLFTTTQWADFTLVVDFRCVDADANSGIFIRSALEPTDPTKDCDEINIASDDNPYPTGSIVARKRRDDAKFPKPDADGWQTIRISAFGDQIMVWVGGYLVTKLDAPSPRAKGYIGLQSNGGRVEFKNARLRPLRSLGGKSIFNGRDLEGWNTNLAGPASFNVTEARELEVLGGSGQLESDDVFGNFIMQFDCKVNGDGLNSGVFFRCIPGEKMNGYECQISNKYNKGNRDEPTDCGTGGIYRRVDARRVVADDHKWFTVTMNVDGPHIAVWVDGMLVTDWTDTREPDENPRRGLRVAPGTFCIQAHDPTTDLLFRKMWVEELPSSNN